MTIKTKLRKAAAALTALCLIAGCTTKPKDPEVYIDDKNEEIVLTLFAQGEVVANLIQQCFNEVINRKQEKTFILYSDSGLLLRRRRTLLPRATVKKTGKRRSGRSVYHSRRRRAGI